MGDPFFLLLTHLTKWLNSKFDWDPKQLEFLNSVITDLEGFLNQTGLGAGLFSGDYADRVHAVYGEYDFAYERLPDKENAILVWGYTFEIFRNLIALRDIQAGKNSRIYLDGEFSLKWMLPLMETAARTNRVSFETVQAYFDKLIFADKNIGFDLDDYTPLLNQDLIN